ncbi:hypothetical protein NSPZN2_10127 [Nitrospira defluvii]|uniref:Uncharacterized protein n=1 Tax=Nitrospira defluvii TaxID=330214 RepID=A0ABM8QC21_9BACT|nr:hypothetical protein NSPZN2_10127 [Nitrospira defluvii]
MAHAGEPIMSQVTSRFLKPTLITSFQRGGELCSTARVERGLSEAARSASKEYSSPPCSFPRLKGFVFSHHILL